MSLTVLSNYAANVAQRNLRASDAQAAASLAKLSSGSRVVSAKDDAASMAIGSRLSANVAALKQASVNAGQAVSMLQIADGAMGKVQDVLTRMKSLAVQAGSGQLSDTERAMLDTEYQADLSEITRIAKSTEFNGQQLVNGSLTTDGNAVNGTGVFGVANGVQSITAHGLASSSSDNYTLSYATDGTFTLDAGGGTTYTGKIDSSLLDSNGALTTGTSVKLTSSSAGGDVVIALNTAFDAATAVAASTNNGLHFTGSDTTSYSFKVGTGTDSTKDVITVSISGINADNLGLTGTDIATSATADAASSAIDNAIVTLNTARSAVGASQNRIEFAAANLATATENQEAARSSLMDLDVASEMTVFTSKQILVQAGISMLAQANQMPQQLMRLFQ
ncbi:MAG: flagellin [Rhodospirillaceae bacterium]|nr:flagellin [Rhodospirillaceae bacterium]